MVKLKCDSNRIAPVDNTVYPELKTTLMGLQFPQCIGIAAGFDKQAEAINELFKSGLSFVEVGGITPKAQPGNPSPRMSVYMRTKELSTVSV